MIVIKDNAFIDEDAIVFKSSRSSGPGGQNVNKVNTRVTAFFDVVNSTGFSQPQKRRILRKLATRASKEGVIRVASQKHRTQRANRNAAVERLAELVRGALETKRPRRKTKTPARAKERRLEEKKRRGLLKKQRARVNFKADSGD